ncbi:pentatricopeptide repeat-containing protein At5g21222 [Lathyrus oleraceus]|uniref:pentatricopeptide repeat-containing protein At5g21222 n=1 Tax=Pisum sativum TaxID=3888 RepID=UPI0021CEEF1E|nr:pentatricopeptide repeat-containing protein At5g21222-like [Pisum sativum]
MEFVQSSCKTIEVQKKLHAKIKIVKTDSLPLIELGKMKSYILNSKSQRIRDGLLEVAVVLYHAEIVFKCSGLLMLLKLDVCPVFLLRHCNLWGCYLLPAADTCLLQLLNNRRFGIAEAGIGGVHRALLSELTGLQLSSIDEPQTSAYKVQSEIRTMKLLHHPNIVRIHEVIGTKTKIYIVMEYVSGVQLLYNMSYADKLNECEARKLFQHLVDVVDYCHNKGIFHHDLKPKNLLLDNQENLKVS